LSKPVTQINYMAQETLSVGKSEANGPKRSILTYVSGEKGKDPHYLLRTPGGTTLRFEQGSTEIAGILSQEASALVNASQTDEPLVLAEKIIASFARQGITIQGHENALGAFLPLLDALLKIEQRVTALKAEGVKQAALSSVEAAILAPRSQWGAFGNLNTASKEAAEMVVQAVVISALGDVITPDAVATAKRIADIDATLVARATERVKLALAAMGAGAGKFIEETGAGVGHGAGRMVDGVITGVVDGATRMLPAAGERAGKALGGIAGGAKRGFKQAPEEPQK
jgi:hypothetical protein